MSPAVFDLSLAATDLSVSRGSQCVAAGVSFDLAPGGALVLRGPNGSGKTSILRAVAGFSEIDQGTLTVSAPSGRGDLAETRATSMHWIGGGDGLAHRLSVAETLAYWQGVLRAPPGGLSPDEVLSEVGLGEMHNRRVGSLSTGQRRRLGVARLLLAPRAIWLLDEPTNGLDDPGRALLLEVIARHRRQGGLVLMATHEAGLLPDALSLRLTVPVPA